MFKTQTIVMPMDRGGVFEETVVNEETKKDEKFFTSTDFDLKIMEFMAGVLEEGGTVLGLMFAVATEHLVALITYTDEPIPMQPDNGKIVIPDLKLKT